MAFTLDTKARFPTSASTTTTATTLETGYTCGSYVGALVVYLYWAGTTARTGGDPTYAGSALTQASTRQTVTETSTEAWYMLSPPTGSYTLSIPNSGGRTMWVHIASANTTSASVTFDYDSVGTNAITAANPGVSVVTVAANTIVFAGVATGDNSWLPTARTGTFIYDDDIGTYGSGTQYVIKTSAGSSTIGWTDATSDDYNAIGVAFKEKPRGWTLTTGCPVHLLTSGSVDLTQHVPEYTLTTGCPVQLHTADNVTITFHNLLVVQNTEQLHTSEHVILTQNYSLVSNNSTHIQTSENINLTQHYSITSNSAEQKQTAENVSLIAHYAITSNNVEQKQTSGNVNLSAHYAITLNNAEQKQTAENINLTQHYNITVQNATQLQTGENVSLSAHYSLTVQNSTQLQTAEKINLTQIFSLSINNSAHTHTAGNTLLIQTRYNGARDFNGTTNRIDWSSIIDTTAMPITISAWIKLHTYHVSHTQYIFTTHQSGDTAYGLAFTIYAGLDRLDFFRNGTTLMDRITVTDSIPIGQWVHVLVTHTGLITDYTTVHHYINGIEATYAVGANGAGEYTSNGSWSVGGRIYDDARNLDGEIGEVTVWNRVLDAGEIALLASRNPLKSGTYIPNGLLFTVHPDEPKDLVTGQIGTLDGTTLTYGPNLDFPDYNLTVQNSTQSHTAENVNLTQHYSIISKDSIHSHTSENIILIRGYMLSANNAVQLQTSEDITLIQNYILIVMIATQLMTSDNVSFGGGIAMKTMHYIRLRRR